MRMNDKRLQVSDTPRCDVPDRLAEIPLVAMGWRSMRDEHLRRESEKKRLERELVCMAEETCRLRKTAKGLASPETGEEKQWKQLFSIADRLQEALARLNLTIVAPEGAPYTSELMELLDNTAQLPKRGISEPFVAEVITPAIMYQGALVRMGSAVIAVPDSQTNEETCETQG